MGKRKGLGKGRKRLEKKKRLALRKGKNGSRISYIYLLSGGRGKENK